MVAKFRTERQLINGKMMRKCTGYNGNGCETWIPDGKVSRCRLCLNAYARSYYAVERMRDSKIISKNPDNALVRNEFKGCTEQELAALETGNVNALLRCPDKHRELRKGDS